MPLGRFESGAPLLSTMFWLCLFASQPGELQYRSTDLCRPLLEMPGCMVHMHCSELGRSSFVFQKTSVVVVGQCC